MTDDRAARLLGSVREGWHGLAGGDAASCPGCPVCALTDQAGRLDPATAEHLQAAAGHLAAAGRELLAVLGGRAASDPDPVGPDPTDPDPTGPDPSGPDPSGPDPTGPDPTGPVPPVADTGGPVAAAWTKIPVSTPDSDEEHP